MIETLIEIPRNCSSTLDEDNVRINVRLPAQVLADRIGCTRQWATKMLRDFERSGTLRRHGAWISFSKEQLRLHRSQKVG